MSITTDTRWDSFEKLDRNRLYHLILTTLDEHREKGLTARELAVILYDKGYIRSKERQATAPRLTELVDSGSLIVIGKKQDEISMKNVAIYALAEREITNGFNKRTTAVS